MQNTLIFQCVKCGTALTAPVVEVADVGSLCFDYEEDIVPQGRYAVSNGEYFAYSEGNFIVNLDDAINTQNHTNISRLNGCCGLHGDDGINTLCDNGHEVGTKFADCCTPRGIYFDKQLVVPCAG